MSILPEPEERQTPPGVDSGDTFAKIERQQRTQKMEAVGRLAGGIANDFNNLLAIIHGRCELMLRNPVDAAKVRADLELILATTVRANALTRQLLQFSQQQQRHAEVFSLNSLITSLNPALTSLLGPNCTLTLKLAPDLIAIRADTAQLEQVLRNLTANAREAMPQGGQVTIETQNFRLNAKTSERYLGLPDGQYIALMVTDTGAGMDETTKSHLFEPFFTTKEPGKGPGLGLATVYGIVKQSGGNIWVNSQPNKGTAFTIYLPKNFDSSAELRAVEGAT